MNSEQADGDYHQGVDTAPPDLPERMTWEELEKLPAEIAGEIELWDGRVVWMRRGPAAHQQYTALLWRELLRCHAEFGASPSAPCVRVGVECNVFLGASGKSNYLTPDFLVYRCPESEFEDIRAHSVVLVGEVLSPSNRSVDIETKKLRYASAGIPWYWEVSLSRDPRGIETVRAYGLESDHGKLPGGVSPLRPANYILTGEWTPSDRDGIVVDHPFQIRIPWDALTY